MRTSKGCHDDEWHENDPMVSIIKEAKLSEPVRGVPQARQAYVLYEDERGVCAATEHAIVDGRLRPGRVVSLHGLGERFGRATGADIPRILPPEVFVSTQTIFGWVSGARYAPMWFAMQGRQWAHRVWWPNLLWLAGRKSGRVRVFAVGSSRRPAGSMRLYHAPLMNIGADGSLCEGSARLPRIMHEGVLEAIEKCVYESNFSHINHQETLKGGASDREHVAYWRDKERTKERVRVGELKPWGRLNEALKG